MAETGEEFYAELTDFDENQVDDWVRENVLPALIWKAPNAYSFTATMNGERRRDYYGLDLGFVNVFETWLLDNFSGFYETWLLKLQHVEFEMWSDCLAYDWVLFCELFGGALKVPKYIYYIPFDISTLFKVKGIDPDINREEFAGLAEDSNKHNALWDAKVIKACYEKLMASG